MLKQLCVDSAVKCWAESCKENSEQMSIFEESGVWIEWIHPDLALEVS